MSYTQVEYTTIVTSCIIPSRNTAWNFKCDFHSL